MAARATYPLVALLVLLTGGDAEDSGRSVESDGACNLTALSTALDGMLSTYDRQWAPAAPARVQLALEVCHATIQEDSGTARLLADLHMWWDDPRLAWNASEGCGAALVAAERLWRPDVDVLSAARARDAGDAALRARVTAAGRVAWARRLDLEAPVALDLTAWPRDFHRITFKFGSRAHFVDEIELALRDVEPSTVSESGAWELVEIESSEDKLVRAGATTRLAVFAVTLQRRAAATGAAAGAVLTAAGLLLVAAALLPPQTRAPLCAAASFTTALWLAAAISRVGNASGAPRVLCALGALCACGGAAAAAAALAVRVARCSWPAPAALRRLRSHPAALRWLISLEVQGGEDSALWLVAGQLFDGLCVLALLLAVSLTTMLVAVLD